MRMKSRKFSLEQKKKKKDDMVRGWGGVFNK